MHPYSQSYKTNDSYVTSTVCFTSVTYLMQKLQNVATYNASLLVCRLLSKSTYIMYTLEKKISPDIFPLWSSTDRHQTVGDVTT